MKAARRALDAGDLLGGDDHDFVVNLYLALLRRWPDETGYRHFMGLVAGRPERRLDAIRLMAGSEETHRVGGSVEIGAGPVVPADPRRALALSLDLRTTWLQEQLADVRRALELLAGAGGPELSALGAELIEARDAALRSEIGALRREVGASLEELRGLLGARGAAAAAAADGAAEGGPPARQVVDYVADLLSVAEARFEARFRALEARVMEAVSPPGAPPRMTDE